MSDDFRHYDLWKTTNRDDERIGRIGDGRPVTRDACRCGRSRALSPWYDALCPICRATKEER